MYNQTRSMPKTIMFSPWTTTTRYYTWWVIFWGKVCQISLPSIYFLHMSFAKFNELMRQHIVQGSFNPGAKFLILFINPNDHSTNKAQKQFAFNVFSLMYNRYNAANVVFLYASSGDSYTIYVTNPYQNLTECGKYLFLRRVKMDSFCEQCFVI